MEFRGLTLDKFQEDSVAALDENKSVVVSAPTGSGKTLIADYVINRDYKEKRVIYTAPIKALSNQKFKDFSEDYGEKYVGLMTGDIVLNPNANILVMTTEIYRNMAVTQDAFLEKVSYVVFDEIHFINDPERGSIWEESIIFSPKHIRFICLSATIPNAKEFSDWIFAIKKHPIVTIKHDKRSVPLHKTFYDIDIEFASLEKIRDVANIPRYRRRGGKRPKPLPKPNHVHVIDHMRNKMPMIYFTFSRRETEVKAKQLFRKHWFRHDPEITHFVRKKLKKAPQAMQTLSSTMLLQQVLPFGIGFHHAGLLPLSKEITEELFAMGKIKVLYATETFAVGVNMPAKAVVMDSIEKFDGRGFRYMTSKEYFQMAGRAGRRGIDKEGFVVTLIHRPIFDYNKVKKTTERDIEPIRSQFRLSINMVINLIDQHSKESIEKILRQSFHSYQKYKEKFATRPSLEQHRIFGNLKKRLTKMGYIQNNVLTYKGKFIANIFVDELEFGEIFGTAFKQDLNDYQMLLLIGALVYEPREREQFTEFFIDDAFKKVRKKLKNHKYLSKNSRFANMKKISALLYPAYRGESFFDLLERTNMPEGNLVRFLRQILDRIGQIIKATDDERLVWVLESAKNKINHTLEEVGVL